MGLKEHILAGAKFRRTNIPITIAAVGSGSTSITDGLPAGIILSVSSSQPIRLRLYDDVTSRDATGEPARTFITPPDQNVAIIADVSMSVAGQYTLDPVVYAMPVTNQLHYRVDPVGTTPQVSINVYPLEQTDIAATVGTNKITLPATATAGSGLTVSGSIVPPNPPPKVVVSKTYALISASLNTGIGRLRLYSKLSSINDATEKARPFTTEASASVGLIVDAIITQSSGPFQFYPKIIGANLNNLGSNLATTDIGGENAVYYILTNQATGNISASLHVFSFED